MGKKLDLTGQKFGKLLVIREAGRSKTNRIMWLCRCECGVEKVVGRNELRSGDTLSCGCHKAKCLHDLRAKHMLTGSKQFIAWRNMKSRCVDPKSDSYYLYGLRGITYDPKWETFEGFWEDMGESWREGLSIDRIDVNGNYCKENCKWSTLKEQANNKRSNRILEYKGKSQTVAQWAEECGMKYNSLSQRINKYGWSIEKALTTPVREFKNGK